MGGDQSRFDSRADALATLGIRQAGGIANEQYAVIENLSLGAAKQAVGVARDAAVGDRDGARLAKIAYEVFHMMRDLMRVGAAESLIEVVVFAEDPAVAQHIAAEEELGDFAGDLRPRGLRPVHLKLDFLRQHRGG